MGNSSAVVFFMELGCQEFGAMPLCKNEICIINSELIDLVGAYAVVNISHFKEVLC